MCILAEAPLALAPFLLATTLLVIKTALAAVTCLLVDVPPWLWALGICRAVLWL